ncbi:putative zinc transporter ZIP domain-containing protein [Neospora caninum Liverpool]|uniref:Putative zinc transporter ZIP domain-containing protein n=1 Tax=Neospora caninum (strain Liverpool) TaxID=572307 RepID=F0VGP0_NEOCL|nr:putative zinc transporter ZIP domain-containing protein [Neospora caninum Liverpool]CBZ52884.1 putative zinc transporter ZIP domain-containing protein [Neospora caninum Liverpool]CEL66866.1 TPA: zinc transporter ZIP domain-containing protein,putative [Neospora caninum Liverpool]|eukprot:XP_003882916.1 putative zinc transporter ZIP domain-containing protein [Neospora caninum Liverpool]
MKRAKMKAKRRRFSLISAPRSPFRGVPFWLYSLGMIFASRFLRVFASSSSQSAWPSSPSGDPTGPYLSTPPTSLSPSLSPSSASSLYSLSPSSSSLSSLSPPLSPSLSPSPSSPSSPSSLSSLSAFSTFSILSPVNHQVNGEDEEQRWSEEGARIALSVLASQGEARPLSVSSRSLSALTEEPGAEGDARSAGLLRRGSTERDEPSPRSDRFLPTLGSDISVADLETRALLFSHEEGQAEETALLSTRLYAAGSIFVCALAGAVPPLLFLQKEQEQRLQGRLRPAPPGVSSEGITPLTAKYIRLVMSFTGGVLLSVGLLHLLPSAQRQIAVELARQKLREDHKTATASSRDLGSGSFPGKSGEAETERRKAELGDGGSRGETQDRERDVADEGERGEPRGAQSRGEDAESRRKRGASGDAGTTASVSIESHKTFPYASVCCLVGVLLVMVLEALAEAEHTHEVHSHIHTHEHVRTHLHTEKEEVEAEAGSARGAYVPPALGAAPAFSGVRQGRHGDELKHAALEAAGSGFGPKEAGGGAEAERREGGSEERSWVKACKTKAGDGREGFCSLSSYASSCSASWHHSLSSASLCSSCLLPEAGKEDSETLAHPPPAADRATALCVVSPSPASAPPFAVSRAAPFHSFPSSCAASLRGVASTGCSFRNLFRRSNSCKEGTGNMAGKPPQVCPYRSTLSARSLYTAGCAVTAAAELSCAAAAPCWCEDGESEDERAAYPCSQRVIPEAEKGFVPAPKRGTLGGSAGSRRFMACSCEGGRQHSPSSDRARGESEIGERRRCEMALGQEGEGRGRMEGMRGPRIRSASCCSQACPFAGTSCCVGRLPPTPHRPRPLSPSKGRVVKSAGEVVDVDSGSSVSGRQRKLEEGERRRESVDEHSASFCSIVGEDSGDRKHRPGDIFISQGSFTRHPGHRGGTAIGYSRSADHLASNVESGNRFCSPEMHADSMPKSKCCKTSAEQDEGKPSRECGHRGPSLLAAATSLSRFASRERGVWKPTQSRRRRLPNSACRGRSGSPASLSSPLLAHATPRFPSSQSSHCDCGPLSPRSDVCMYTSPGFEESVRRYTHRWNAAEVAQRHGCPPLYFSSCSEEAGAVCLLGPDRTDEAGLTDPEYLDRANKRRSRMRSRCIYTVRNRCRKLCNRRHRVASSCGRCSSGNEGSRLLPPYGSSSTSATLADELRHEGDKAGAKELLVSGVLMLALSFHSLMEGVTLGTAPRPQLVAFAVLVHKGLESFALGSSLMQAQTHLKTFVWQMLAFASMTPVGVIVGIAITWLTGDGRGRSAPGSASSEALGMFSPRFFSFFLPLLPGLLTGVGSGTFLHVSLLECIAPQLMRCRAEGKASLLSVIAAVCLGAGVMVILA